MLLGNNLTSVKFLRKEICFINDKYPEKPLRYKITEPFYVFGLLPTSPIS